MFLHKTSQILHILDRGLWQNAMAEIENVSWPSAGTAQNFLRARLQFFPAGEEQNRIQVALHGAAKFQAAPAFVQRNAPVEPNHLGSGFFHRRKKSGAIRTEINDWRSAALQALHQMGNMREHIATVIVHAQTADPTIEDLNHVRTGAHLLSSVFGDYADQLSHQLIPVRGRVVHHLLGMDIVPRSAAFDHVAGKREWRTAESNHWQAIAKVLGHQSYRFTDISQLGCTISAQMRDVLFGPNRLLDDRTFPRAEVKREFHDLEWQKEIGEDDSCIHPQCFGSADRYCGRQRGILADLQQRMLFADSAVFGHVASCLTHEPHRRTLSRHRFAGSHENGIRRGHELLNVAFSRVSMRSTAS